MSPKNNLPKFPEMPPDHGRNLGPPPREWPPRTPDVTTLNVVPVRDVTAPLHAPDTTMVFHAGQVHNADEVHSAVRVERRPIDGDPERQHLQLVSEGLTRFAYDYPDRNRLVEIGTDDSLRIHEGWLLINNRLRLGRREGRWQPTRALAVDGWRDAPNPAKRLWIQLLGRRAAEIL